MTQVIGTRFGVELLKLLLQLACSDRAVHGVEAKAILGLSRLWQVPKPEAAALSEALRQGKGLPPPNLSVLRSSPGKVLKSLHQLAKADGQASFDETALIAEVETLLGTRLSS